MAKDLTQEEISELLNAALSLPAPDEAYLKVMHDLMLQMQQALYKQTLLIESYHRDYLKVKLLEHSYHQINELGILPRYQCFVNNEDLTEEESEAYKQGWQQGLTRIFSTHLIMDSWYATQSAQDREFWRQLLLAEQSPVTVNVTWEDEQPLVQVRIAVSGFNLTKQESVLHREDLPIATECFQRWGVEGFAGWLSVKVGRQRRGVMTGSYTHARRLAQDYYGEVDGK